MTTLIDICAGTIICCVAIIAVITTIAFIKKIINDEL